MIKAVIFDMDGTIIDSMQWHTKAWEELFLKEKGILIPEKDFEKVKGMTDLFSLKHICKLHKVRVNALEWRLKKKKIYTKFLKEKVKIYPGVKNLIKKLSKKYKIGIATSSWDLETKIVMQKFGLKKYISKVIGKEDVRNHKPHPQIYQKMANLLKVDPKECVVVEDSVPGILSAKRAKCKCVAVTNSFPASKLKKADLIVKSLKDKKVENFISNC